MKKKRIILYYSILSFFCQCMVVAGPVMAAETAITEEQKNTILNHCDTIKDNLRKVQREDSRARVYLGRYYETILSKFITPLNLRLVENNMSDVKLIDNQTNFAARRTGFVNDYISYQQALEEVVNIDCKAEPVKFYEKLKVAQERRKNVNKDVTKMRALTDEQVNLVKSLKASLK